MASQWWVVPEGTIGQIVSGLIPGTHISLVHVVQASARPSGSPVYGPFATKAEAQAQANELNGIARSASAAGANADPGAPPGTQVSVPTGLNAIGDFFSKLGEKNTWLRVAEVLLGVALMIVGVAKLAAGTPAGRAAASIGMKTALL